MKTVAQLFLVGVAALAVACVFYVAYPLTADATDVCTGANCRYMYCTSNADCGPAQWTGAPSCQGNDIWQNFTVHSCGNPGTTQSFCQAQTTPRYQATCADGQVCKGGRCTPPYVPQTCFNHTLKKCVGNKLYWYNSCGARQDVAKDCVASGLVCKDSQCIQPASTGSTGSPQAGGTGGTPGTPSGGTNQSNAAHYMTQCHNGNVTWFDAKGTANDIFRNCNDNNSCTIDSCDNSQCSQVLTCDGSTCATSSTDYQTYCSQTNNGTAAVAGSSVREFIRKWYGWIILILILIILFVVIFRRLSTRT